MYKDTTDATRYYESLFVRLRQRRKALPCKNISQPAGDDAAVVPAISGTEMPLPYAGCPPLESVSQYESISWGAVTAFPSPEHFATSDSLPPVIGEEGYDK